MTLYIKSKPTKFNKLKLILIAFILYTILLSGCGETTKSQAPSLSSTISYELSEKKTVTITLYDVFGNEAYQTQDSNTKSGTNIITLTSSDVTTTSTSNSIYFYIIKDPNGIVITQGKTVFN